MILDQLEKRGLIQPPPWLITNVMNLSLMGSQAYGTSHEQSDFDVYGWCIPPKELIFPHLAGEVPGFGRQQKRFEQWLQPHIWDMDALGGKGHEYDFTVFSIVKYFHL